MRAVGAEAVVPDKGCVSHACVYVYVYIFVYMCVYISGLKRLYSTKADGHSLIRLGAGITGLFHVQ